MKIAYNPTDKPNITSEQLGLFNKDIIFDLSGLATYARGVQVGKVYQKFLKSTNSTTIGYDGLVPFPDYNSNSKNRFLKEDGTWVIPDAGTFDGMDSDRFVTTHNISEADTDKRSINVRFEPKWTDTNSSSYILRVGSSTEGLPDNNCGDGNLLHIQGRFSDTAFLLLSGWYNNSLYFRSGNEVDGVDNTTKEEADTGLFKNAWNRIPFFTDLTGSNIKLTGYLWDANNFESITSNDTVSSALSKLECKALFVYSWLTSDANDADEKINKWHEVEHFLEGIEETTLNSILNTKAAKATTIQGYGLWEKYTDLNEAPMGAFFCGGKSVANSPESEHYISGLTLAKDENAQYRTQLGFVENRVFTRQENGENNWSQWREIAFLGDVAKKATTLAGYGITDAVTLNTDQTITGVKTFTNGIKTPIIVNQTSDNALFIGATDNYYCDLNTQLSSGHSAIIPFFQKIGSATSTTGDFGSARKGVIRLSGNASESQLLFDHYNATIHYRGSTSNGAFTEWKRIAFTDGLVANATNADNATWLIPNSGLAYGNSGLQYFNLNGTQGTITNANVTPNAGWYHIIRQNHANNLGFFSDIATPLNGAEIKYGLYWRAVSSGTNYGWYNLLDSNNYSKYAVTLDTAQTITGEKIFQQGTGNIPLRIRNTTDFAFIQAGSSGTNNTASLAISGLSTSMLTSLQVYATNTAFHGNINIKGVLSSDSVSTINTSGYSQYIKSLGRTDMITGTTKPGYPGISMVEAYGNNTGYPVTYGNIILVLGITASGAGLLCLGWTGTDVIGNIYYRSLRDLTNSWSEWKRLAFKETTLSGYGITDAVPFLNMVNASNLKSIGVGYVNANGANGENGGIISFGSVSHQTQIHSDHSGGNIHWRVNNNGSLTNWKNLLDSNNYSNYAVTLNTNQTISGVKTLSANLLSATRGTLDIGDEYNSFNRIFAWHYKPNSLTKPILSSGKWYRIWNFSQGVAGTFQKNAIISINKAYNHEQGQTITLAVSINNWGQTYVINQLSGTTGLITKVRVTGKWNYSYVDVYISSAENAEQYSVSGYGNGERVDFEELADDATNDSTRTEELTVVNGTAVNYPLSLQNATPLVVNSTTMVANLHAQYSTNLKGDDNRNVNEAPYSYGTCAVNWRFKSAKAIGLATNDYEYAGVLHLTPWGNKTGGPDHQLAFESNGKIKYRSGLSTWSDWTELLTDANGVTLGTEQIVTGHKTFKNDGYYTSTFNSTLSDGKVRLLLLNNGEAKLMLAYDGLGSLLYDYGSAQTLRIQNDGDLLFTKSIIASSQLKSNVATGTSPLAVNSTTMVANLNANYLGGLNKDSFQKAVYDYVNVSGTADTTALPTVIAPSIYNGTNSIGGLFKFYDTKFYNGRSNTSNRCQLAYGYDVDSIHFRRYKDGTWYDWKKVVFTEGTDNLKITNSSARTTYVKDSTHSMFFGYSDGSYNRGLYDNSLSNWIMYTDSSNQTFINQWLGNVGIKTGNATLTAALQVGGSILASGDITAYSDRRLKSNIQTLENRGYVEPVTFEKDGKQCIGFIAQDVEEKYPELVNSEGEYLSLNYQQYTAVLQALIIELYKRIKELENGFSKL